MGDAREYNNQEVIIDELYNDSIVIKQLSQTPQIFRAEVTNQADSPLTILKKKNNLVIILNDKKFLDFSMEEEYPAESTFGVLNRVTPKIIKDNFVIDFHFTGKYSWTGYMRHSSERIKLIFNQTNLDMDQTIQYFDVGPVQSIRFIPKTDQLGVFEANIAFQSPSEISVVRKNGDFMLQMPYQVSYAAKKPQGIEDYPVQEVPAAQKRVQESREAVQFKDEFQGDLIKQQPVPVEESDVQSELFDETYSGGIPWNKKVTSLKFYDTSLKDVLRFLAMSNELNMVIGEGVRDSVTINLEDVTLKQALDKIIHTHECEYYVEDQIITVQPVSMKFAGGKVTKIYRLNYADANNLQKIIQKIATDPERVEIFYPEFLDFTLAGKNRQTAGKVAVQGIRRASILIVTDRPDKINEIDHIIEELDQPPGQVMIESKLVELSPEITNDLGIDWEKSLDLIWSKNAVNSDESSVSISSSPENKFQFSGQGRAGTLTPMQYAALLDVLKESKNTKLISYPRLLAMDNEESSISVGETVPIPRIQRGMGTGDVVTFEYKEVNIQLNVSPHIQEDGSIIMYVNPVIEEITGWVEAGGSQAPITSKRMVNSIVKVNDNGTIVIGGLIKSQQIKTVHKVWLLGSLPLFGRLFQHDRLEERQTDLLIFITPTIIEAG